MLRVCICVALWALLAGVPAALLAAETPSAPDDLHLRVGSGRLAVPAVVPDPADATHLRVAGAAPSGPTADAPSHASAVGGDGTGRVVVVLQPPGSVAGAVFAPVAVAALDPHGCGATDAGDWVPLPPGLRRALGVTNGVLVVHPPDASLQAGDVILALGGEDVRDGREAVTLLSCRPPGKALRLTVLRDGAHRQIEWRPVAGALPARVPQVPRPPPQ
jgi:S1-C subfamily serine protease